MKIDTLTFQKVRTRNRKNYINRWLIRRTVTWTNDGYYTIGKVMKSGDQVWLTLNGDTELSYDQMLQVHRFMAMEVVRARNPVRA